MARYRFARSVHADTASGRHRQIDAALLRPRRLRRFGARPAVAPDTSEPGASAPGAVRLAAAQLPGLTSRARGRFAPAAGSNRSRRGIVLLFVLALLALFSLVTVTFVIVARQAKQGARANAAADRNRTSHESQLNLAVLQLLRGTENPLSVARTHSLLEDMYGDDAVTGTVVDGKKMKDGQTDADNPLTSSVKPQYRFGTQVQQFYVQLDADLDVPLYMYSGAYNGRTVTMLTGEAAGKSSRVLDTMASTITNPSAHASPNLIGPTHQLSVITFGASIAVGDRVLINGAAFNGTGFGFGFSLPAPAVPKRPTLYLGSHDQFGHEYALMPNPVFFSPNITDTDLGMTATVTPWYTDPAGPGGADESYDAVDYQNMLLALHVPDPTINGGVPVPIPSLHRPELIYYWYVRKCKIDGVTPKPMNQVTQQDLDDLKNLSGMNLRRAMLRPNLIDHPKFTGGNPNFNPCSLGSTTDAGRWDVDNDSDGVCDSIWVDLGAEVQTAPDGRKYKPLFAPLVIDLDGKFNLNAHGNLAQVVFNASASPPSRSLDLLGATDGTRRGPYAGMGTSNIVPPANYLPIGQGYGPAEINLRFLFDGAGGTAGPANMQNEYGRLLYGETNAANTPVEGRYGEGYKSIANVPAMPGYFDPPTVGRPSFGDWLDDYVRNFDMPANYFNSPNTPFPVTPPMSPNPTPPPRFGSYGSPPDLNGNGALGLDVRGQPWYGDTNLQFGTGQQFAGFGEWYSTTNYDKLNDPYEIDLSHSGRGRMYSPSRAVAGPFSTVDNPFSPGDLERLLRYNDVDASSLSSRLLLLAPETFKNGFGGSPADAAYRRALVTTESWDVPVPAAVMTPDLLLKEFGASTTPEISATDGLSESPVNSAASLSFVELVRRRLSEANTNGRTYLSSYQQQALRQLVSWDLARGERLDLNRPLGNGVDGNANNVVDEPGEIPAAGESMWPATSAGQSRNDSELTNPAMDLNNDGKITVSGTATPPLAKPLADNYDDYARQLMARHLYVLAWAVIDSTQDATNTTLDAIEPLVDKSKANRRDRRIALAERLAQWAVNMVDFRDRDSIMTGFEYDVYPFSDESATQDGYPWDTDDDLTSIDTTANPNVLRGVVWGVERPELLITETFAFHNRRTDDLSSPGGKVTDAMNPDPHLDQVKRPLGGLVVELYAPWNRTEAPSPELADYQSHRLDAGISSWQVNLSKVAPGGAPAWRMVVAKESGIDKAPEASDWDSAPTGYNTNIERTVYFIAKPAQFPVTDHRRPYFRKTGTTADVVIPANSYAVIGPADDTNRTDLWDKAGTAGKVTLEMTETTPFSMLGLPAAYPKTPPDAAAQIKKPLAVIINEPRRLSISEPYPAEGTLPADPGNAQYAAWEAGMPTGSDAPITPADDIPWDEGNADVPQFNGTTEGKEDARNADASWRTIYLQRLADPTKPWDRQTNPYLSVDRMPVDLTVYNSETAVVTMGFPVDQNPNQYHWGTRQRGKLEVTTLPGGSTETTFNIWANNPCMAPSNGDPDSAKFTHTLGYLNEAAKLAKEPAGAPITVYPKRLVNSMSPAADEMTNPYQATLGDEYVGDPSTPFPWLTWNNRPYISKHELLNVPATRPYELLFYHSVRHPTIAASINAPDSPAGKSPYGITGLLRGGASPTPEDIFTGLQFGYLSPLLMSSWYSPAAGAQYSLPNFHRMLEFVTVPSRFAGTEMFLNATSTNYFLAGTSPSGHRYNAPFNRVSTLREPGKVNINTITDIRVWQGLLNYLPDGSVGVPSLASWKKMIASRRGYGANDPAQALILDPAVGPPVTANGTPLPTFFANPFRSYAGLYLVPIPELQNYNFANAQPAGLTVAHPSGGVWQNEIDATLLRPDPASQGTSKVPTPLFSDAPDAPTDVKAYASSVANPYFHYRQIEKLSNLVTTRSNVYAVWITVGYFEVERVAVDTGHPDGWRLGQELGSDTGEIQRHRAFYLIDRSIPVGFQRGQDHNVQDTILLKRIIE